MNAHQRRKAKRYAARPYRYGKTRFFDHAGVTEHQDEVEVYGPDPSFWDRQVAPYPVLYRNPMAEGPGGYAGFTIDDERRPIWGPPGAPVAPTSGLIVTAGTRPEFPWGPFEPIGDESEAVVKERLAKFRNVY